jgi:hypothetical protein
MTTIERDIEEIKEALNLLCSFFGIGKIPQRNVMQIRPEIEKAFDRLQKRRDKRRIDYERETKR